MSSTMLFPSRLKHPFIENKELLATSRDPGGWPRPFVNSLKLEPENKGIVWPTNKRFLQQLELFSGNEDNCEQCLGRI